MKEWGFALIGIGIIYVVIAFNMSVTVNSTSLEVMGYGGDGGVVNLDLIARRQNHLIVAALITLIGVLLTIFGLHQNQSSSTANQEEQTKPEFSGERDLGSDAYRL